MSMMDDDDIETDQEAAERRHEELIEAIGVVAGSKYIALWAIAVLLLLILIKI